MKKIFFILLGFAALLPTAISQTAPRTTAKPRTADWTTPTEASGYRTTPRYAETMAYIRRVAATAPKQVKLEVFGKTGERRDLWTVIVSKDGVFDPIAIHKANRPVVLIQNAIHAGEMDGKDSCLALLREMVITKSQAKLLDRAVIVIIPIYNADGHERFGPYNRINQNGPEQMGWRTTSVNLNLNRDYIKADAVETRAFLKLWNKWLPDFFFDDHVTDGADYQYAITYGVDNGPDIFPQTAKWIRESLNPEINKSVTAAGHVIGPLINLVDEADPAKGITAGQSVPRFSTGYTIAQNRPGMLVEMHMLKDYKTRVTGNYELLRSTLEIINRDADKLLANNRAADAATIAAGKSKGEVVLKLNSSTESTPFNFLGYKFKISDSEISGTKWIEYSKEPLNTLVPIPSALKVTKSVRVPAAYIIPAQWTRVIDVLEAHGLKLIRTSKDFTTQAEIYSCQQPAWQSIPFESRHTASFSGARMQDTGFAPSAEPGDACTLTTENVSYPAGSVLVPTNQRAAKVAVHFLEPEGPDSALTWGFFDAIFEQKEYGEGYVLEKLSREMLAKDPKLKQEFENKLATDKAFAANPFARLNFFYMHSPYWDTHIGLYPVGRLQTLDGVPLRGAKPSPPSHP